jgi:hypothetical protein
MTNTELLASAAQLTTHVAAPYKGRADRDCRALVTEYARAAKPYADLCAAVTEQYPACCRAGTAHAHVQWMVKWLDSDVAAWVAANRGAKAAKVAEAPKAPKVDALAAMKNLAATTAKVAEAASAEEHATRNSTVEAAAPAKPKAKGKVPA